MNNKLLFLSLVFVVSIIALNAGVPIAGEEAVYYAPISKSVQGATSLGEDSPYVYRPWNADEQKKLYQRAKNATELIPISLFTSKIDFKEYRQTADHGQLKGKLRALVDNETAWPEWIYIAQFVDLATKFQILCSSSDIVESESLRDLDIEREMKPALDLKKPVATDLFNPAGTGTPIHAAVYYPFYSGDTPLGILVFVKGFWEERKPSIEEQLTVLERKFRRLESQIAQLQTAQPPAKPKPSAAVEIKEKDLLRLSYGTGRMDGKRSYGGGGQAIFFKHPKGNYTLKYVELFGSRYGYPQPPAEDFNIYILDKNMKVLSTIPIPYSTFERGEEKWVAMQVENILVPEEFWIAVAFNAQQTKGIYVGYENTGQASHSKIGTPETGFRPFEEKADWLIRAYLQKKPKDK